ncbi:MAG: hypothetical protein J5886_06520 [Bacteroidales bacterium]|nr:hypothetical protein [Bacteroidales bacterium]
MIKKIVLWVENEPERLRNFKRDIEEDGEIELVVLKDSLSATAYLDENIEKLSGAVLDIESFISPDKEEEVKTSFCRVRDKILGLEYRNKIEYFAFTGKGKYLKDKKGFEDEYGCRIFDKNYEGIEAEEYLKEIVGRHIIAKISSKYSSAFISEAIQLDLLKVLMVLEKHDYRNAGIYNDIRKIMDWVMEYCYKIGLSQVRFDGANLAECSKFLGLGQMADQGLVPLYIQRCLHSVVSIANEGSHRLQIDKDTKEGKAPYLVRSTVFELLNILNWLGTVPTDEDSVTEREDLTLAILNKKL